MRPEDKPTHTGIRIAALALLALAGVILIAALQRSAAGAQGFELQSTAAGADKETMKKNKGKRGPPGHPGPPGHEGPRGPTGPRGADANGVLKQNISINWQNNQHAGQDRQSFEAPGIGHGEVRCSPPTGSEPNGTQWVRFFPDDSTAANVKTTMWTTRVGGPHSTSYNVGTARLTEFTGADFYEGMNTQPVGIDLTSSGSFIGLITVEPRQSGAPTPNPTSFQLTWHWNFDAPVDSRRCYVAGSFYTGTGI